MDQIKFGKFISSLRNESGLTQEQLAEKLNVGNKTVSKWECGNSTPDFETIVKLSELFNVTLHELSICERISIKGIEKEDILKAVDRKQLKNLSNKRKLKYLTIIIFCIVALFAMLYTGINYNTTKIYTLQSLNNEFRIHGTYTKTKKHSIFAITELIYIGNSNYIQSTIINNHDYELFNGTKRIYSHNLTKNIINDTEMTIRQALSQVNILIDSNTHNINNLEEYSDITLVITYKNELGKLKQITIKLELIENYANNRIW